jgi:O-antigen ligase
MHNRCASWLCGVIEALAFALALLSAWPFGCVHPFFQAILFIGIACLLGCWAGRVILEKRAPWSVCPIVVCLAGTCLLAMLQLAPLSDEWLRALSPPTAAWQDLLILALDELPSDTSPGDSTLSLAPGETRQCLLQAIALLAYFGASRNNVRSPGAFYRLAWLSTANGVLLSLLGLGQLAASVPNMVFWSVPTRGQVFATFICRNHFAYYLNLSLGLAVGLLCGTRHFQVQEGSDARRGLERWRELFADPRVIWLVCAISIMLAGLLACLSRGGVLGIVAGGLVALLLLRFRSTGLSRGVAGFLVLAFTAALLTWQGYERIGRRWETLWEDNNHGEARAVVWARVLPLTARFPWFGTGLGTFGLIEPTMRLPGDDFTILNEHAHNDFLELWIEGGIGQLVLVLALIALVARRGVQAFFRHGATRNGGLALGGLIGLTAIVVQSFVDFGLRIPAVALLTAAVAAMLVNLAETPALEGQGAATEVSWPMRGLLAGALLAVAFLLVNQGRTQDMAERYRLASRRAPQQRRVGYLRAAVACVPDRATPHLALADALQAAPETRGQGEALRHLVRARQLSPLHLDAQEKYMRLAESMSLPQARERGLARMLPLSPSEPALWFQAGQLALAQGKRDEACRCWHTALLCSPQTLRQIGAAVPVTLSPQEFLNQVLGERPALIAAALIEIAPIRADAQATALFETTALSLLDGRCGASNASDYLVKARLHVRRNEAALAQAAFTAALAREPRAAWRLEFCDHLVQTGNYPQARRELLVFLDSDPQHAQARALLHAVYDKLAEMPKHVRP